jgi:hypothetical protein
MNETIVQPGVIDSFAGFLRYGPIGFAGLMLVLVIVALMVRTMDPARERILRQMMYVGAGCFAIAVAANFFAMSGAYTLYLRVFPLDVGSKQILPKPIVKANGKLLDENMTYVVKQDVTTIVDVSDAIDFVRDVRDQNSQQKQLLASIAKASETMVSELQRVPAILDKNCPGGGSGQPAASNPAVIAITNKTLATIAGFKPSAAELSSRPEPAFK